jgi:hypothetical protein
MRHRIGSSRDLSHGRGLPMAAQPAAEECHDRRPTR